MIKMKYADGAVLNKPDGDRLSSERIKKIDNNQPMDSTLPTRCDVRERLRTLQDSIMALMGTDEARWDVSNLSYCFWCLSTLRKCLTTFGVGNQPILCGNLKSLSEYLENILVEGGPDGHRAHGEGTLTKKSTGNKRKLRRKSVHKQLKDLRNVVKIPELGQQNADLQHLIDQFYIQTRQLITEHCLHNALLSKELDNYIDKRLLPNERREHLLAPTQLSNKPIGRYHDQLSSGDCKINGDGHDMILDNFDKVLESSNYDFDFMEFSNNFVPRCKASSVGSHRSRLKRDSDFDEGFSENESLDDSRSNQNIECAERGGLHYRGDCNYNSSNSKLDEDFHRDLGGICCSEGLAEEGRIEDESDSDGGTDLLNCVNATVNEFNEIMESKASDVRSIPPCSGCDDYGGNGWMPKASDRSASPQIPNLEEHIVPAAVTVTTLPPQYQNANERIHTPSKRAAFSADHTGEHLSPPLPPAANGNLPYLNFDHMSQVLVSQMNVQHWCSYNCNYAPSRALKNHEQASAALDNFDQRGVQPWFPCVSNNVLTTNAYNVLHSQPQAHRMLVSPHFNLDPVAHNMKQLPQLLRPPQHHPYDTEYCDRRYCPIGPGAFPGPQHRPSLGGPPGPGPNTNNHANATVVVASPGVFSLALDKSQRACCFYMRGGCKKEDCEYAHDLSKVTCKFWEKGDCFKADTCPFKHGYRKL